MEKAEMFLSLKETLVLLEEEDLLARIEEALTSGVDPLAIIERGLLPGLKVIGEKFQDEEIFLPELMRSALIFQGVMAVLQPKIREQGRIIQKKGTVVIGTVKGDIHTIGKNIVRLLLEIGGFEVHDLGVDVDTFKFIEKAKEVNADIIALSALLTSTLSGQRDVVEALAGQDLRRRFKVIVGGGAATEKWAEEIKADGYAETAPAAVELAEGLVARRLREGGRGL